MKTTSPAISASGFSLVEVIIAVSLVGMIVFVIGNIPNAINLVTSSQSESRIREVVAKKIEDIRISGYDNLVNGTTAINDSRLNSLSNASAFTVIANCPITICPNGEEVKQVSVTISWKENSEPKTYKVVTLIGKDGLR